MKYAQTALIITANWQFFPIKVPFNEVTVNTERLDQFFGASLLDFGEK